MKLLILCCLTAVAAKPANIKPEAVEVVNYDVYNPGQPDGRFIYSFELTDGTKVDAEGKKVNVVNDDKEVEALVINGSYSYVIDGVAYTVNYVADQDGYRPTIVTGPSDIKPPGAAPINPSLLASLLGAGSG